MLGNFGHCTCHRCQTRARHKFTYSEYIGYIRNHPISSRIGTGTGNNSEPGGIFQSFSLFLLKSFWFSLFFSWSFCFTWSTHCRFFHEWHWMTYHICLFQHSIVHSWDCAFLTGHRLQSIYFEIKTEKVRNVVSISWLFETNVYTILVYQAGPLRTILCYIQRL